MKRTADKKSETGIAAVSVSMELWLLLVLSSGDLESCSRVKQMARHQLQSLEERRGNRKLPPPLPFLSFKS